MAQSLGVPVSAYGFRLKQQVRRHLRAIQRSRARVKAYFKHPKIRYAGG
jgi:hypothetical protein